MLIFLMRRALILDLDFTLLHLEWIPDSIEVPGRTRSAWIAPRTIELLGELQTRFEIVLATARSLDGTNWVVDGLRERGVFVDALVIEDGARLGAPHALQPFEPHFDVEAWRARFDETRDEAEFEWQFDFENCLVARCEDTRASEELLQRWARDWAGELEIVRFYRDGRKVYALPARAQKWSALQRVLGERAAGAAGAGDGENDLVWLPRVEFPATFARAHPALVDAVRARGGFVSGLHSHAGIAEILERFREI
jgi:hydroxymethylpyrimidine pyrophosphatase-like HAD family hydrolase